MDGRFAGVSGCHLVGEGEAGRFTCSVRERPVVVGFFCPLFFVYYTVARDGRTDGRDRSVGRCNPADAAMTIFFSLLFWADGRELRCLPPATRAVRRVRAWQKCGTSAAALVLCKCYGAGGWSTVFRGRRCNILDKFKWWCSLFCVYIAGRLGRDGNGKWWGVWVSSEQSSSSDPPLRADNLGDF